MLMYKMSWTDERMDDFAAETRRRFDRVDERFDKVDERFDKIDRRFERMDERFDRLQHLLIQFCGLMLAAVIGLLATQL
jgi:DNA anti-recombination protein RmuC